MAGIETTTGGAVYGDTSTGSYYSNILQDLFLPVMADTVIYPNALLKRLPRDTERVEGKLVKFPIHYDDANGVTALGPDGLLPEPDTERFAQYAFGIRHIYVRMKFDGISRDASRTQMASWLKIIENEAKSKAKILARQRQRMYHNDGSGRLAMISAASANLGAAMGNLTYTLIINQGIESPATCTTSPTRWIKTNQILAFISSAGTIRGYGQVASISGATITISNVSANGGGGNVTSQDWVVTAAQLASTFATKDTAFKNEPMGIQGILSDTDPDDGTATGFQGVDSDAAANVWHRATILAASATPRPLTLYLLDTAWTTAIELGDAVPTVAWGSFPIVRRYAELLITDRRFVGTRDFDGGYNALDYNGVPFMADRDFYNNRLALIDETDLRMYVMADPQWMDMDGSIYHRLSDKDAYQATMYCRETMGSDVRDKHVLITDLIE